MEREFFEISLTDLRFYSHHGVFPQERKVGNEFSVDAMVKIPVDFDPLEDSLEKSISYADLYEIIREEMALPKDLLETVAASIGRRIKSNWPVVTECIIKITKITPPVPGIQGHASVTYTLLLATKLS